MQDKKQLIPSFQVDHSCLMPGIYESRVDIVGDEYVTTFDIRMKMPNREPVVHPNAMHTIEHIVATYLRNDPEWKEKVVYWGPMGCLTGCYLIVNGRPAPRELQPVMVRAFRYLEGFEGEIPGAAPECCGNWLLHDLPMARYEAAVFADRLEKDPCYVYPEKIG